MTQDAPDLEQDAVSATLRFRPLDGPEITVEQHMLGLKPAILITPLMEGEVVSFEVTAWGFGTEEIGDLADLLEGLSEIVRDGRPTEDADPCGWDMGEGDQCLLPTGHDGAHS